jgi:hypothetical protein
MNTTTTLLAAAALAFAAAGSAVAQEAGSDDWMNASVSQTRAQVQAELVQARADGSIKAFSAGYIPTLAAGATRADVAAGVRAARASGELDRIDAEAWAFGAPAGTAQTRLARAPR